MLRNRKCGDENCQTSQCTESLSLREVKTLNEDAIVNLGALKIMWAA